MKRAAFWIGLAFQVACRLPQPELSVCLAELAEGRADKGDGGGVVWPRVLLRAEAATADCRGDRIVSPAATCEAPAHPTVLERVEVFEQALNDDASQRFVWVATHALDSGERWGPAAIVQMHHGGVRVQRLGRMRAFSMHPTIELMKLSEAALLQVRDARCTPDGTCVPLVRFLTVQGSRLEPTPLVDDEGACMEEGGLDLYRMAPLRKGGQAELQRSVQRTEDGLVVREQLRVLEATHAQSSWSVVRQAERTRFLHAGTQGLVTQPSLWADVVADL